MRLPCDDSQTFTVPTMSAGHDDKKGVIIAGDLRKTIFKRVANDHIRSLTARIVGKHFAVLNDSHRKSDHTAQLNDCHGYMATPADDQLFFVPDHLRVDLLSLHNAHAGAFDPCQELLVPLHKSVLFRGPDKFPVRAYSLLADRLTLKDRESCDLTVGVALVNFLIKFCFICAHISLRIYLQSDSFHPLSPEPWSVLQPDIPTHCLLRHGMFGRHGKLINPSRIMARLFHHSRNRKSFSGMTR